MIPVNIDPAVQETTAQGYVSVPDFVIMDFKTTFWSFFLGRLGSFHEMTTATLIRCFKSDACCVIKKNANRK